MFIKSGHVLYCFSCVVYSRLKAFGKKNGKIKLTEKIAILQYDDDDYDNDDDYDVFLKIKHLM